MDKMKAWDKWQYDITYVDKDEMSTLHVLTDTTNLGKIIDEIVDNGGFDIRVRKRENDWSRN